MLETVKTNQKPEVQIHDLRVHKAKDRQRIIRGVINENHRNRLALGLNSQLLSGIPCKYVLVEKEEEIPYWDGIVTDSNPQNFTFGVYHPDTCDFSSLTRLRRATESACVSRVIKVDYELVRGLILRESNGRERVIHYRL
jgi:hypothetical protein